MAFLYVLVSKKDKKLYFGVTEDVHKRLDQHNAGRVNSTKGRRPLALLDAKQFPSMRIARYNEWKLKHSAHFRHQYLQERNISVGE